LRTPVPSTEGFADPSSAAMCANGLALLAIDSTAEARRPHRFQLAALRSPSTRERLRWPGTSCLFMTQRKAENRSSHNAHERPYQASAPPSGIGANGTLGCRFTAPRNWAATPLTSIPAWPGKPSP
jgi:hypothetical protein